MSRRVVTLLSPFGNSARDWGSLLTEGPLPPLELHTLLAWFLLLTHFSIEEVDSRIADKALREITRDLLLQCLRDNSSNSRNKGIFLKRFLSS